MAYFVSSVKAKKMHYNGNLYHPGEEIPDFGLGKYDDLLLDDKQVESNGDGTGVEEKIANLAQWRKDHMISQDSERREEEEYFKDVAKYQATRDLEIEETE